MGQTMDLFYMIDKLNCLETTPMIEVLLHHAFDCSAPNKLLLWKRDGVTQRMNHAPTAEYYPLALPNLGNYYYNFLSRIMSTEPNVDNKITMFKCYGDNSKHVHGNTSPPFQKSEIADFLQKYASGGFLCKTEAEIKKLIRKAKDYLTHAKLLERLVKSAELKVFNGARIEFIVSSIEQRVGSVYEFPKDFYINSSQAALEYCEQFDLISATTLAKEDEMLVYARYMEYFPPISKTLKNHLDRVLDSLVYNMHYVDFTIGKHDTLMRLIFLRWEI
jgi:hypothetical protein